MINTHETATGPTMAQVLIDEIRAIIDAVCEDESNAYDPIRGLTEQADLSCDTLLDAQVRRTPRVQHEGLVLAEDYHISFTDDSDLTMLAEWCSDRIHMTALNAPDDRWLFDPEQAPGRVTIHPMGAPGCRIFDILGSLPDNC